MDGGGIVKRGKGKGGKGRELGEDGQDEEEWEKRADRAAAREDGVQGKTG